MLAVKAAKEAQNHKECNRQASTQLGNNHQAEH
jgi:hypothetical protein